MFGAGRYDNLHGDENECHGHCGLCDDCIDRNSELCESLYEQWLNTEVLNEITF